MHLTRTDKERLESIRCLITENVAVHFRIEELAAKAFMSRSNLVKKYKAYFHISLYAYLLQLRLDSAKALLGETDDPIRTVARRCGFKHPCNFTIAFREMFGVTPRQYRKS
ncbi:MAG: AraC family transcriptional regulator [Chitinophagaceae bacterium]|nr:MAG: AraC family transcriptional regulator [Chitinophagaceae bacterium]